MSKKMLKEMINASERKLAVPLMGFPGARITNTSIKQNLFNPRLQATSLEMLTREIDPDVVFPMMDLSIEAGALGLPVRFPLHESPSIEEHPVSTTEDLEPLRNIDILTDARGWGALETIRLLKYKIDKPLCAYVAGPFTLTGLLMGANDICMALLDDPVGTSEVIEFSLRIVTRYAKALENVGADMICVLEPTAMMLSPDDFKRFSGDYLARLSNALKSSVILHICGNTTHLIKEMCATGVQALSLDHAIDLPDVMSDIPDDIVVMGNIDPSGIMLRGSEEQVENVSLALLKKMDAYDNFILSTGCDLPPDTPIENIKAFMNMSFAQEITHKFKVS